MRRKTKKAGQSAKEYYKQKREEINKKNIFSVPAQIYTYIYTGNTPLEYSYSVSNAFFTDGKWNWKVINNTNTGCTYFTLN